jgi:Protein of unknown function (DUF1592)/Protein of unknown function (DUF1588)/Protein of unknown function (DUF1595)/Protein of unknown function (DUF1585)/Protein of unknown function (DUF1587)
MGVVGPAPGESAPGAFGPTGNGGPGSSGAQGPGEPSTGGGNNGGPMTPAPTSMPPAWTDPGSSVPPPSACSAQASGVLAPSTMRRLTGDEYRRSVRDLLGMAADAALPLTLPDESRIDGFDNNAGAQILTDKHVQGLTDAIETLTTSLLGDATRRNTVFGCAPTGATRPTCTRSFITRLGRRAFRRPLTTEEIDRFAALAATQDSDPEPYAGLELVLRAMLTSPNFLFLVELGTADAARPGHFRLTGFEIATRLSYLMVGAGPTEAMLDAAAVGRLNTPDGVAEAARALAADPRAALIRRQFGTAWLQSDSLAGIDPATRADPRFDQTMRAAMQEETARFVDELFSRSTGSMLDVVTADWTHVNGRLAPHYGLPAPAGGNWTRTTMPAGQRGAGVLTQASFLTMTGPHAGIEPIKRGRYVRQVLLCERLPSPPSDIPSIDAVKLPANATERQRLAAHRDVPACSGCHQLLDEVGFAFSGYDRLGAARTSDDGGNPIDSSGQLLGFDPPAFNGPRELGQKLRASPKLSLCMVTQMYRFGLGRSETGEDACAIQAIETRFRAGGETFAALLDAFVRSDAFLWRRPATSGGTP